MQADRHIHDCNNQNCVNQTRFYMFVQQQSVYIVAISTLKSSWANRGKFKRVDIENKSIQCITDATLQVGIHLCKCKIAGHTNSYCPT